MINAFPYTYNLFQALRAYLIILQHSELCSLFWMAVSIWACIHYCICVWILHVCMCIRTSASSMSLFCNNEGQRFRKLHIQLCTLACEAVKSQGCRRTGYQMCFLIICSCAYQQQIRELCWKSFSVACQPISQQRKTELLSPLQNQLYPCCYSYRIVSFLRSQIVIYHPAFSLSCVNRRPSVTVKSHGSRFVFVTEKWSQ